MPMRLAGNDQRLTDNSSSTALRRITNCSTKKSYRDYSGQALQILGARMTASQVQPLGVAASTSIHAKHNPALGLLRDEYDYIVCGSGTSGSVVARRLAENPDTSVLLLEAGGSDEVESVRNPLIWYTNLGSERDWGFVADPDIHVNGRSMPMSMGKVLGGGSSINVMVWARGHQTDWDYFADQTGDATWNYESTLETYRTIENWQGQPDAMRRGSDGLLFVQPPPDPNPVAMAMLTAAARKGIATFEDHNGAMMEGAGGAALANILVRDGERSSVFRSYVGPILTQGNLTILTHATVTRVLLEGARCVGVEYIVDGQIATVRSSVETVLSLGALNTPKVLMQSGIGDANLLEAHHIAVAQHLPGVGKNLQDHVMVSGCVWQYKTPTAPRNNVGESTFFWKSQPALAEPDIQAFLAEIPIATPEAQMGYDMAAHSWSLLPGLVRPKSKGELILSGPAPTDPMRIRTNALSEPDDLKALVRGVEMCRDIGNDIAMEDFCGREVMPGNLRGSALENFVRNAASTVWHMCGTAKMGRDNMSVVDGQLRVYGIDRLRIADASVLPRVPTGNTQAPCVIVGERLGRLLTSAR